ncbi:MAG: acetate--CoA ligase family protein [Proteobacteria bacterium]|nr:acetate--CoA ligase family protein [Pseudomonadota bacterium]
MSEQIAAIISPTSIAVVGASNRPGSVGQSVFHNILNAGYTGVLYPVNPKARSIQSVKSYPRLGDIPDAVDMAVIIVPATAVAATVVEAAEKGVKGLIVITAGFKEIGGEGVQLEKEVQALVRKHNICMVGPNCLGVMNTSPDVKLNASFASKMPRRGRIAFISQSGALCTAVLDYADGRNVGFSKFISFGNKADVSEIDLLRYLKDDPDTEVILMYLEDISDGRRFIETAREITWDAKKPMLAVKSGRSPEGAKAAASHTGSLAGSDATYDAIFFQSGIQRVEGIDELFNYAIAFARQPVPKGNRIAIVTNAGGPGIMATDAAMRHGLTLATLSDETQAKLKEHLPSTANIHNPVDIIGDATHERYEAALRQVLEDPGVEGAIVILSPQAMTDPLETAEIVPRVIQGIDKPVLCSFMGIVDVSEGIRYLEAHNLPNYTFPESSVRAMGAMVRFGDLLRLDRRCVRRVAADRDSAADIIQRKLGGRDEAYMTENEAGELLQAYGFPVLRHRLAAGPDQLESVLEYVGLPVAMKIASPDIIHKFDAGGVRLKIKSLEAARKAYDEIVANAKAFKEEARIQGVLVERMARPGLEVILGCTRDPKFGPIVMFGLGGTFVEAIKDVSFRLAPMWEISAEIMIRSIKSYRLLQGVRGNPPSDVDAIKDCVLRLSQMVADHPEIDELDINPLIVYPEGEGCVVADSRIMLRRTNIQSSPPSADC